MSSFPRRLQKKLMAKSGVAQVPVYGASRGPLKPRPVIAMRYPLVPGHIGYSIDGVAEHAPIEKPKPARKPRAKKAAA